MRNFNARNVNRDRSRLSLERLGNRLAPGSVVGDPLSAAIPAQIASLTPQSSDIVAPASSLTLVNLPQADATPPVDPGVTLTPPPSNDAALVVVASALTQPVDAPAPSTVGDEPFANFTPTPLAPPPAVPDAAPQGGSSGGSAVSLATVPATPPGPGAPPAGPSNPPPVVPPPGTNPPAPPVANDDSYNVVGGSLTVPASAGLLANDTNPTGQPLTASLVNPPVFGSVAVNPNGSFTYTNNNPGLTQTVTFTYQATAGGLTSNTATVTLNITAATPAPPTLVNPGDQASNTGEPVSLQLQGVSPAGNSLAYSAAGLPSGLTVDPATGEIAGLIDHSASLTNAVTVTATDTVTGLSASQNFNWAVTVVSHAPTLDPIADQTNSAGDAVDLWANGGSVDGSPLTYSIAGQPSGVGIDLNSGEITGNIANSAYSSTPYQVTVTVSDGTLSASQSFTWTVGAIQLTNPGDQNGTKGDAVSLPIIAHDYSGGTLSYSITGLPPGLTINPTTGVISGAIAAGTVNADGWQVTVTATNGTDSASQEFDWTIDARVNIGPIADQMHIEGDTVSLQVSATTTGTLPLTYSATGLANGLSIDINSGLISGTLAPGSANYGTPSYGGSSPTVTVTATDGTYIARTTFKWTVASNAGQLLLAAAADEKNTKQYWIDQADAEIAGYKTNLPAGASSLDIAIARNKFITAAYAKIYLADPKAFAWAGLAALASEEVGKGLVELKATMAKILPLPWWLPALPPPFGLPISAQALLAYQQLSKTADLLGQGNLAVYDDIYWQFLAYKSGGVAQMRALNKAEELTDAQLAIWEKVANKDFSGAGQDIAENEQLNILQPLFDKMPSIASQAAAGKSQPLFPGATPFKDIGSNIADKDKRWDDWIVLNLWPEWVAYSGSAAGQAWIKKMMDTLSEPDR